MNIEDALSDARAAARKLAADVGSNPALVPPRMQLAKLLIELDQESEAEGHLREVIRLQPANLAAMALLAKLCDSAARLGERADFLFLATKHELCGELLLAEALDTLIAAARWEEVIELSRAFGPEPSNHVLSAKARAFCAVDRHDDAVNALRLCVIRGIEDLRDVVSRLIVSGSPLIAARLVNALDGDAVISDHLADARRAVRTYCQREYAATAASDDPQRFTELAEALLELRPDNESLQKAVTRGCILLLHRARAARAAGQTAASLVLARKAASVRSGGPKMWRRGAAELLARSGSTREAIQILLCSGADETDVKRAASLMAANTDWSDLHDLLQTIPWPADCGAQRDAATKEIGLQVRALIEHGHNLSCKLAKKLLETTLALVAIAGPAACRGMASEVINRSRRTICGAGQGDRLLLTELCRLHLTLAPKDRDVARRYVSLLQSFGRHQDAYDELRSQLKVDPHDEDFWSRLAASCSQLGLARQASAARNRALLMKDSAVFESR
jgi:tetratricopeptide (TPR) repeat protein